MTTSESFKGGMHNDFLGSMKPNTSSTIIHLQWWMLIHVMVNLFSSLPNIQNTPNWFVFWATNNYIIWAFDGWRVGYKGHSNSPMLLSVQLINEKKMVFCYHIAQSMLYSTFQYNRLHSILGFEWEAMIWAQSIVNVKVLCELGN